ncbi:MAG: hypothetical protein U0797_08190 [Gemmataceae bacterium]
MASRLFPDGILVEFGARVMNEAMEAKLNSALAALGLQLDREVESHVRFLKEQFAEIAGKYVRLRRLMNEATGGWKDAEELDKLSRELADRIRQACEESQGRLIAILAPYPRAASGEECRPYGNVPRTGSVMERTGGSRRRRDGVCSAAGRVQERGCREPQLADG